MKTADALAIGAVVVVVGFWLINTVVPQASLGGQFKLIGQGIGNLGVGVSNAGNEYLDATQPPVSG